VTTAKLPFPSCFWFCYNEESDVAFLFLVLLQRTRSQHLCCCRLLDLSFVAMKKVTTTNCHHLLLFWFCYSKEGCHCLFFTVAMKKLPLPFFFGFVATKKAMIVSYRHLLLYGCVAMKKVTIVNYCCLLLYGCVVTKKATIVSYCCLLFYGYVATKKATVTCYH